MQDGKKPSEVRRYKIGFFVLAAVVTLMLLSSSLILSAFDRSPSYVINRVFDFGHIESDSPMVFLPSYYYDGLDILPHTFDKNVKTLDDFYKWKNGSILDKYRDRPTIHQIPHNYTMVLSEERDGYTLDKFTMQTFYPDDIIFYKLTSTHSTTAKKAGTILVIPGTGNQGARDVMGEPSSISPYYYQGEIAKRLVIEGYDVYTIELHGYGEREFNLEQSCISKSKIDRLTSCSAKHLNNRLAMYGISLHTIQTDEITQVLAHIVYDESAEDIAVVGLSLGAGHAMSQAIINTDVVDAVVVASGLASNVAHSPISYQTVGNGQFLCCNTNDRAATIAPKPMYVSYGKNEVGIFGWEANTNHTGNFLKNVYVLHGAKDNFYYHVHDGIHKYHVESIIDFLKNSHRMTGRLPCILIHNYHIILHICQFKITFRHSYSKLVLGSFCTRIL